MGSKTFGVYLAKWRHPSWKWPGRYYGCHREENANCRIFIRDAVREWFASSPRISLRRFLSKNEAGIPPIRRTEENLSTVYFLHLSSEWKSLSVSIHSNTCFPPIYFDPLFTFSRLDLPINVSSPYLISSSFHPYRIHDETPCYILTKKNKRACKVIRFALTDKVPTELFSTFVGETY